MRKIPKWGIVIIGLALVVGGPLIIHLCYYKWSLTLITTQWEAKDVLAYYGAVLAAVGAAWGVYLSIRASHEDYKEDVRKRVLPFIAVIPLERKTHFDPFLIKDANEKISEEPDEYVEYRLDRIYYIITPQGIEMKYGLTEQQKKILHQDGWVWRRTPDGGEVLTATNYFSLPIEIENVGNGAAIKLRVGFNRTADINKQYRIMTLTPNKTIYLHVFSTEPFDIINERYILEFYYEDIYANQYVQKFAVYFKHDEITERNCTVIDLAGKQERITETKTNTLAKKDAEQEECASN